MDPLPQAEADLISTCIATQDQGPSWVTRCRPDTSGMAKYTIAIRGENDPQRSARPIGGRVDKAPHLKLRRTCVEDHFAPLLAQLEQSGPLTFNGLGVLVYDHTADMLLETVVEEALWRLVQLGKVQFTTLAPSLFAIEPTGEDVPLPTGRTTHRALKRRRQPDEDPQQSLF